MKNGQHIFSALEYSKELRAAGFTQEQSELQARQFELMKYEIDSELATKKDIKLIEKEIAELKKDTKDQTLKIIAVLGGLITLFKFLPDFFN